MATAAVTRERPIIFSGPMVRAIIEGRKTQTRLVVKPQPEAWRHDKAGWELAMPDCRPLYPDSFARSYCPYGQPGDRLWVRETYSPYLGAADAGSPRCVAYKADGQELRPFWKPSIHMPRWASRITLEITGVRVERLQDISEADAMAEGMDYGSWTPHQYKHPIGVIFDDAPGGKWSIGKCNFASSWQSIHGPGSWAANPWVWVIEFRKAGG